MNDTEEKTQEVRLVYATLRLESREYKSHFTSQNGPRVNHQSFNIINNNLNNERTLISTNLLDLEVDFRRESCVYRSGSLIVEYH